MSVRWYWWALAFVPALSGFVSLSVFGVGNFRSSGLVASIGITIGLLAVLVFLGKPWRGSTRFWRWLGSLLVVLLGFVSLLGLAEGLPEFLQARGLFVDVDSYGPRAVVVNNGVFVVVGDEKRGGAVWRSDDGATWFRVSDLLAFDGLEMADAVVIEGRIVAIGRPFDTGEVHVLTSFDGQVWELTGRFENEDWGTSATAIAQSGNDVIAVTDIIGNDVEFFKSANLAVWTATDPAPVFDDGEEGSDVACNRTVCVAVGKHISGYRPELDADSGVVWTSAGGDQWEQVHEDLNAASFNAVASNTAGFLIVGNDHDDQAIAWKSSDGRQWNLATSSDFDGYTIDGVGALDSGYAIFGRDTAANSILVWTSTDLERWEIAVVDTTWAC